MLATNISSAALVCAKENAERNKVSIHLAKGSLSQPIKRENPFDIICFNPPFLPGMSGCEKPFGWKCGPEGLAFINAAIDKGYRFLQKNGTLLLTAFSTHDLSAIERRAMKRYQVKIEIAHKGKLFNLLPVVWEKPLLTKLEKKERLPSR